MYLSNATAHTAQISIDCNNVRFNYASFPQGSSSASYSVKVDGSTVASGNFSVTGPSDSKSVAINLTGNHSVTAHTAWTADGGGSADAADDVRCGGTPPPPTCPEGTAPGGQDGQPGNDSSCMSLTPPTPVPPPTCPDGTTAMPNTNPLVCQKIVIECGPGASLVNGQCQTPPKVIVKEKIRYKTVIKYKTKKVVVYKYKTKKVCGCAKGTHAIYKNGKLVACGIEAQG